MEGKVAVFGDSDFVMPFSALGLDTFEAAETTAETLEIAKRIAEAKYALVVIAENTAAKVEEAFIAQQKMPVPCIVVVPFTAEPTGIATRSLGKALRMATGINILQDV